ncbi:MAG TPA: UBP-type zinc finger domain-containing protein [Edaphobacter sp.]|nr:UBP-type zinc finger domain-containing protein [Edaphobacter sp.]HUZ97065.1 UBP-type zinc finger domain-containing protein [Edaphobacter sp.]
MLVLTTAALLYRIHVEEAALCSAFGEEYAVYSRMTKRLFLACIDSDGMEWGEVDCQKVFGRRAIMRCTHLKEIQKVKPSSKGCEDCLKIGGQWVHLRMCMICGHVACCDSSPNRHATAHFHATRHPIMRSVEPGEDWGWCYVDEIEVNVV